MTFPSIEEKSKKNNIPFVSVIIPTYNRKDILCLTLLGIIQQDYPKDKYEIIVVDDGSDDGTNKLVKGFIKKYNFIKYIYQDKEGYRVALARNLGGKQAKGEILIFLDNDIVALPNLISNYVKTIRDYDIVLGYSSAYFNDEIYDIQRIRKILYFDPNNLQKIRIIREFRHDLFIDPEKSMSKYNSDIWGFLVSNNFAIKKKIVENENFNEAFIGWGAEDEEYGYRLLKKGYTIKMDKNCIGLHMLHPDEKLVGCYSDSKISTLLKNLIRFFEIHPTNEVKEYIKKRYYELPKEFKNPERETYLLNGLC